MRSFLRYIRRLKFSYSPLVEVSISEKNLLHNIEIFKRHFKNAHIAPVLKSNAYGHGLVTIATILDRQKMPFFIIDSYHEALILRNEKIKTPLLIIGFTREENIYRNPLKNVAFTIISADQLKNLSLNLKIPLNFHLKIDTGMGRQGVSLYELDTSLKILKTNPNIRLEGIMSHLADADNLNEVFTREQIASWNEIARKIKKDFPSVKYCHLSNSAGYFYAEDIVANIARVGIGLYGISPNRKRDKDMGLQPVLEMNSIISGIKNNKRGDKIGYNGTFEVKNEMRVATLPLGYAEGVDRRLSNAGFVKIRNVFCPIIGRVSMNISTVDVTEISHLHTGDLVTIISRNPDDKNSVENIAKICDTIPLEILVHIPSQIRRVVT